MLWKNQFGWASHEGSRLRVSCSMFCMLPLQSNSAKGWTVCAPWRSIDMPCRFRERKFHAAILWRWLYRRGACKIERWSSWSETSTNNSHIFTAATIQSFVWCLTETLSQSQRSISKRLWINSSRGASLVSKSASKNEESSEEAKGKREEWWQG